MYIELDKCNPHPFVLTGSQQFNMLETVSQSLAGRSAIIKLLPFSIEEISRGYPEFDNTPDNLMFTGFYPRLYEQKIDPVIGYSSYLETYIERDLRQITRIQDLSLFRRFLKLCAGRVGQLLNYSKKRLKKRSLFTMDLEMKSAVGR